MTIVLSICAGLIVGFSLYGLVLPRKLAALIHAGMTGFGVWLAVVARLVLAVSLWYSAPVSQTPELFRIIAFFALLGAIILAVVPNRHLRAFVDRAAKWPLSRMRLPYLFGIVIGSFFLWSLYSC